MIGKEFTYKGVNLWQSSAYGNKIVITDVNKNIVLRTKIFEKQNYHGVSKSNTLAGGRLFTFKFTIFGDTKLDRSIGQKLLESIIVPENNPGETDGLYPLYWKTDDGSAVYCNASVYSTPQYDDIEPGTPIITGTFELFSPNPQYLSTTVKSNDGNYGLMGGFTIPFKMPFAMTKNLAEVTANNAGNFACDTRIVIIGSIENPKITNLTTGKYYKLNRTTTNLILDGTGEGYVVTDNGVNVKADRANGSEVIRLIPGNNKLILTGNNFDYESSLDRDIYYNDTFI